MRTTLRMFSRYINSGFLSVRESWTTIQDHPETSDDLYKSVSQQYPLGFVAGLDKL